MPHDANGVEVKAGDKVVVPCTVQSVQPGTDFCNVTVVTEEAMHPGKDKTSLTLNTRQTVKVEPRSPHEPARPPAASRVAGEPAREAKAG